MTLRNLESYFTLDSQEDTLRSIEHCAMAQRTQNMPSALQSENTAPFQYFLSLSEQFESDLLKLRANVDLTQKLVEGFTKTSCITSTGETLEKSHNIYQL